MRDYKLEPMEDEPNPFDNIKWEEIKPAEHRTFQWGTDPELIHIIKTGFKNRYIVVYEDAYELVLGKTEIYTKEEIESKFKIQLI
jgi:hypothetical protein